MTRSERRASVLALLVALVFAFDAHALYKLVDRYGRVTYSDKVPKNFDGTVTRVEIDPATNVQGAPAPASPVPAAADSKPAEAKTEDLATKRRALRERLQARIDAAHARVDAAKKALDESVHPQEDEYQTIQQKTPAKSSDKEGPRPNCMKRESLDGQLQWICPTITPGEKYRERRAKQEAELAAAEAELAAAQREYRRNVD